MDKNNAEPGELGAGSRVTCVLTGLLWPVVCFGVAWNELPEGPEWQSGDVRDLFALMLGGNPSRALYPLLIYSIFCLGCFLWNETWARKQEWVRVGIYGGLLLTIVLGAMLGYVLTSGKGIFIYCLFGSAIPFGTVTVSRNSKNWSRKFPQAWPVITLLAIVLFIGSLMAVVGVFLCFLLSPWITAAGFALACMQLLRTTNNKRFSLFGLLLSTAWISAFSASMRAAYGRALDLYSQLPTDPPPSCFIVTAAAQGHPWLVGSWQTPSGRSINRQLLRFKAFELALSEKCPVAHRRLRNVYNRLGPPIARLIRNRWAADVVYLLLKPLEVVSLNFLKGP